MIDYIKAAKRLRRLLSSVKDQEPELDRIADILERLGIRRKSEHPVTQYFREAGDFLRDLEVAPSITAFLEELSGKAEPAEDTAALRAQIDQMRHEHNESLIILKATQNERDALKTRVNDLYARNTNLESDKSIRDYQIQGLEQEIKALHGAMGSDNPLNQLVLRYCASVIDPGSLPISERLELFQKMLRLAQG